MPPTKLGAALLSQHSAVTKGFPNSANQSADTCQMIPLFEFADFSQLLLTIQQIYIDCLDTVEAHLHVHKPFDAVESCPVWPVIGL